MKLLVLFIFGGSYECSRGFFPTFRSMSCACLAEPRKAQGKKPLELNKGEKGKKTKTSKNTHIAN